MVAVAGLIYLLLCAPITVRACLSLNAVQSRVRVSIGALALCAAFDGVIEPGGIGLRLRPRFGRMPARPSISLQTLRRLRPLAARVLRAVRWEQIALHLRLGLSRADETALAAGALRALAQSVLCALAGAPPCDVRVDADFRAPGLTMTARCIFSVRLGDAMLAIAKAAVNSTIREGLTWISIPSRA